MRTTLIAVAAAAIMAVAAPAAGAATVSLGADGAIVVTGTPGADYIGLQAPGAEDGTLVVSAEGVVSATPACTAEWTGAVVCQWNPAAGARVELGDGNDSAYASSDLPPTAPFTFDGGAGNDDLRADVQSTTLIGGSGDDKLKGWEGNDVIDGGDGNDTIDGKHGADRLSGGAGDDHMSGDEIYDRAPDVIDGGPGFDTVESDWRNAAYDGENEPVTVTLAGGADDGRAGEADDVRGVEKVLAHQAARMVGTDAGEYLGVEQVVASADLAGNGGADTLRGSDGVDKLDGGTGADDLDGGFGDDSIVGGPGQDNISGDRRGGDCGPLWCKYPYGNDTIEARDGERDSITCGAGQDTVRADAVDVVDASCETVERGGSGPECCAPKPDGKQGALALSVGGAKLAKALKRGLTVKLTAPGAGTVKATAALKGKPMAAGSRKVKKAGATSVTVKFTKTARRALRGKRSVKLSVAVRFKPRGGAAVTQRVGATLAR